MNGIFFDPFVLDAQTRGATTVRTYALTYFLLLITIYRRLCRSNQSWTFDLIMRCEAIKETKNQLRKYRPRSDLLVSKSTLPRLLIEVNSKPQTERPEDLIRMLLAGASVVRFANGFLDRFRAEKNFVLFAIYIWKAGKVSRYSLFQEPNNPKVCWTLHINELPG